MSDRKDFKTYYQIVDTASKSGGQGSTRLVKPLLSDEGGTYIIKTLNKPNDPERRRRMHREYAALQTLSVEGIPKAIDSNTEFFDNSEYKLYIVMEYINGKTLSEWCDSDSEGKFNLEELKVFYYKLISILDYCHKAGVIHRDLKPDNIILKDGLLSEPWMVDFGQSFNNNEEDDFITPDAQIMGNRFLYLPELSALSENKRDHRSDYTMAVGILFYILSGKQPGHLVNEKMNLPHQRKITIDKRWNLPAHVIPRIYHFFDIGFQNNINNRFQTIHALTSKFEFAMDHTPISQDQAKILEEFIEARRTSNNEELLAKDELLNNLYSFINGITYAVIKKLDGTFNRIAGKYYHKTDQGIAGETFSFVDKFDSNKKISLKVIAKLIGNEIVFIGEKIDHTLDDNLLLENGEQIIRVGIMDNDREHAQLAIENFLILKTVSEFS